MERQPEEVALGIHVQLAERFAEHEAHWFTRVAIGKQALKDVTTCGNQAKGSWSIQGSHRASLETYHVRGGRRWLAPIEYWGCSFAEGKVTRDRQLTVFEHKHWTFSSRWKSWMQIPKRSLYEPRHGPLAIYFLDATAAFLQDQKLDWGIGWLGCGSKNCWPPGWRRWRSRSVRVCQVSSSRLRLWWQRRIRSRSGWTCPFH